MESGEEGARTNAEAITDKLIELAKGGSIEAARLIGDRAEGKPRQTVTVNVTDRDRVERAVEGLLERARATGDELTREGALALLAEMGDETAAAMMGEEFG